MKEDKEQEAADAQERQLSPIAQLMILEAEHTSDK